MKDLLVDWRIGERHFRHLLVDGDVPQNVGNWQWVAGTGPDASPYHRIFNPVTQSRKFDPDGRLHPPLGARAGRARRQGHPRAVGGPRRSSWQRAGVTLGDDYPEPIVDHAEARVRALAAYAAVGDDKTRAAPGIRWP